SACWSCRRRRPGFRTPRIPRLTSPPSPCAGSRRPPETAGAGLAGVYVRHKRTLCTFVWYAWIMKVTSTEFRKNLFQIVERVLQGELVEVAHKGRLIRLVPENKPLKISRLVQRDTINGTPEDLERAQQ